MDSDPIVISGVAGRFPMSDTIDEFADNLYNNRDMITEDTDCQRWSNEIYGINHRMGKIKEIDKFDGQFFGLLGSYADAVDPQSRILLETTFEAIVDAGVQPMSLRGSRTGVYVATTTFMMPEGMPQEVQKDDHQEAIEAGFSILGSGKCMLANRISYHFDFRGPSYVLDTACSSSLYALANAIKDLRLGKCDQALVGAAQINLQAFTNHLYQHAQLNARDGISKVWDAEADGFVRGEAIICLFLQRKSVAKRVWATVLNANTNIDGYKKNGAAFPSAEAQQDLMEVTAKEAGVDLKEINYVEAHATGTRAGDPEEARAIAGAYSLGCDQILVGLLKSNIGHAEAASGLAAICKAILSFENKCIAANLNLKTLKQEIAEFCPPLVPVNQNITFQPKVAAINGFGIGGANGHVLIQVNDKEPTEESTNIIGSLPRLVNVCGRTQEAVDHIFDFIENQPTKVTREFLALLHEMSKIKNQQNTIGFPYRGSMIIQEVDKRKSFQKTSSRLSGSARPIWFFFSGMGSQWPAMAKEMLKIDIFAKTIKKCADVLLPYQIDLIEILTSEESIHLNSTIGPFVAITSVQIALFDVLAQLNIHPDGVIGHSFGEIACGYADGCLTLEQAVLCAYWRGKIVENKLIPSGAMAAVGLSREEAERQCPANVFVACDNAPDSVTISGLKDDVEKFMEHLQSKEIFVRPVVGANLIPYHTKFLAPVEQVLAERFQKIIPDPKKRSKKWVSTSVTDNEGAGHLASANYYVNNFMNPVELTLGLKSVAEDAIFVELAPHALFTSIIKRSLPSSVYVGLMKRKNNDNQLTYFLSSLSQLYQLGAEVAIEHLYPKVDWPVPRTTSSLSSLIRWDHSQSYFVKKWPEYYYPATASDMIFRFKLNNSDYQFLADHKIDGRVIFPAAGYLLLAWRRLAASRGRQWYELAVTFENVQFKRAVTFDGDSLKLTVRFLDPTGHFVVLDSGNIAASGRIFANQDNPLKLQHLINEDNIQEQSLVLNDKEFYNELRCRGYDYGKNFQVIAEAIVDDSLKWAKAKMKWTDKNHVIAFIDAMLQLPAITIPFRGLFVPTTVDSFRCDPVMFLNFVDKLKNNTETTNENLKKFEEKLKEQGTGCQETVEEAEKSSPTDTTVLVPVHYKADINSVVTVGVEVSVPVTVKVPRRNPTAKELRLEKYEFVPYFEKSGDEIFEQQIQAYISKCSDTMLKILDQWKTEEAVDELIKDNCIIDNLKNEAKKVGENPTQPTPFKNFKDDQMILKLLDRLQEADTNNNEENRFLKKAQEMIEEQNLTVDIIDKAGRYERFIRPLVDLVNENMSTGQELKVAEISLNNFVFGDVKQMFLETFACPVAIDYTVVGNKLKQFENAESAGVRLNQVEWSAEKSLFPSEIASIDLLIHRDSEEFFSLDLEQYLQTAINCVTDGGFLLAIFKVKHTAVEQALAALMQPEKKLPTVDQLERRIQDFETLAINHGLAVISRKDHFFIFTGILFRKVSSNADIAANCQKIVNVKTGDYQEWLDELRETIQEFKERPATDKIWLLADDSNVNGIVGLVTCLRMESGGDRIRYIFDLENRLPKPVDFSIEPYKQLLIRDLVVNIYKDGQFGSMRHLQLSVDRQVLTDSAYVNLQQRGDLSSMRWFDGSHMPVPTFGKESSASAKVDCAVYYSSLNFRDIMLATGRIWTGPEFSLLDCLIGYEFAGRRLDSGQRVFGMTLGHGIATRVTVDSRLLIPCPDHLSLAEAATLYTVYLTVWYGLVERGQIAEGERVLIHSGAGGVGQAAIAICQHFGCRVFTTVGTAEKREFIKNTFGLSDDQIFNSRTVEFEEKVLQATDGQGVDIVLNSLAEDKLLASFRCVAEDGRFIEIGKFDFLQNNPIPSFAFLKNISFHGVGLDKVAMLKTKSTTILQKFADWLAQGLQEGFVKPINYTIFERSEVKEAFKHMMTGKHIGKILVQVRPEEDDRNPKSASQLKVFATPKTWFNSNKVYIVTGALGGMGLGLVYWMVTRGAQKFVLTSRNGIKSDAQKLFVNYLEKLGNLKGEDLIIKIAKEDGSSMESARKIIKSAESVGPVGGVFHLAAVLMDAIFENQTVEGFETVGQAKVQATMNLDSITRELGYPIDFFVVFSSVSCGRGNPGQTPYGYANSVMERVCESRKSAGHHGLAIQWGPIGDVGLLFEIIDEEMLKLAGLTPQRTPSWTSVLDSFLACKEPVVGSLLRTKREMKGRTMEENFINQLWTVMGIDPNTVADSVTIEDVGIESMVLVEFQQKLEKNFGLSLPLNTLKKLSVGEIKELSGQNREIVKTKLKNRVLNTSNTSNRS